MVTTGQRSGMIRKGYVKASAAEENESVLKHAVYRDGGFAAKLMLSRYELTSDNRLRPGILSNYTGTVQKPIFWAWTCRGDSC